MRRPSRSLAGLLIAALAGVLALPGTALATDSYQASVVVSIDVTAETPIVVGDDSAVVAAVSSDASARGSARGFGGQVRFHLDGKAVGSQPLGEDNTVAFTVPAVELPEGEHVLRATYVPPAGSELQRASDTAPIVVTDCVEDCPRGAEVPSDAGGLLPNTGGFWLGLLLIAVLALGAGIVLVGRSRRTA